MSYRSIVLKQNFVVENIISIHYFEYMSDFNFLGESHNFWEFLCVDKGEVEVTAEDRDISLKKGEIIFHQPNEFHSLKANGIISPSLVVISFECLSPQIRFFKNKILTIGEIERNLLASIIIEARNAFSTPLDDPYLEKLKRASTDFFGSEQLIKIYLEQLLIQLYRRYNQGRGIIPLIKSTKSKSDLDVYNRVIDYLETHIYTHLTIEQICKDNLIGRSQLQKLFRDRNNCGIIDYFSKMKIDAAKQLIRDKHLNFTQISDTLGYTSIHYFSRQFKKITGMTPSEYSYSIKILSDP